MGLDGIVSCQSFRAFYPSGLAMATLTEALWNPNRPLAAIRQAHIDAAFGPDAALADDYLRKTEAFLGTGDPHRRALPFSDADTGALSACAAFLQASLTDLEARQNTTDPVRRLSLALLANHARLLAQIVASHQARLAGNQEAAERALDDAADLLRRTERRFSPYIDTMLALRLSVEAHRENPPRMF
jgi:hypothetical protein